MSEHKLSVVLSKDLAALLLRKTTGGGGMQTMINRIHAENGWLPMPELNNIPPSTFNLDKIAAALTVKAPSNVPLAAAPVAVSATVPAIANPWIESLQTRAAALRANLTAVEAQGFQVLPSNPMAVELAQLDRAIASATNGNAPIMPKAAIVQDAPDEPVARRKSSRKRRAAAVSSWANLTPKQHAARVAKMQAARNR